MSGGRVLISSGVGPLEARRFVAKLAERVERLLADAEAHVRDVVVVGDDHAPRSVAFRLAEAPPAAITREQGTHVLVDRSPDRGRASRKRWYAAVSLHDDAPCAQRTAATRIVLDDGDLEIRACRAGGPGGQHVNKVSSAVRVRHVPSGLTVRVACERSQRANVGLARLRLEELLNARVATRVEAAAAAQRLAHYDVVRGDALRTYVVSRDGELCVVLP